MNLISRLCVVVFIQINLLIRFVVLLLTTILAFSAR